MELSSSLLIDKFGLKESLQHHISNALLHTIQFANCCVQSLLLTASQLIFIPAGTKTFQFPAFPILVGFIEKSHSDTHGSKTTYVSPRHFAVSRVLHRHTKPSHPPISIDKINHCLLYDWLNERDA